MTIAVLGGTGKTGRLIVSRLLKSGHKVRVLARDPDKLPPAFGLEMIKGNALDGGKIMLTLTGCHGVVCALGKVKSNPDGALTQATRLLLAGMEKLNLMRLLAITALGVGNSRRQLSFPLNPILPILKKREFADKEGQEKLLETSSLDWTIIRPAPFSEKISPGEYKIGSDLETVGTQVSRDAVADLVLKLIEKPEFIKKTLYITQ